MQVQLDQIRERNIEISNTLAQVKDVNSLSLRAMEEKLLELQKADIEQREQLMEVRLGFAKGTLTRIPDRFT